MAAVAKMIDIGCAMAMRIAQAPMKCTAHCDDHGAAVPGAWEVLKSGVLEAGVGMMEHSLHTLQIMCRSYRQMFRSASLGECEGSDWASFPSAARTVFWDE